MTATTTSPAVHTRRPGLRAWLRMMQAEARMITRDPANVIIPLAVPVLLLVMNGLSLKNPGEEVRPGVTVLDFHTVPVVLSLVVTIIAVINFPGYLATYRKTKVLRRLAVTPASPAMVLVAQMAVTFLQMLFGIALALGIALQFFDAALPSEVLVAVLVLLALCLAMYSVGMIVASVAPTPNAAVAIGLVGFFGMASLGGMFGRMENLPERLAEIGSWLPFGAAVDAFQAAWVGETVAWQNWAGLGVTTVLGVAVASALFRWE
ncbi:ABC transporter permease [Streptomyces sp. CA-294286]|uniref:ABC transporter permease n=1 Tax=Streptomyces sp. CA-294286 TaxID=3240070 RepID=UPI003D8DA943